MGDGTPTKPDIPTKNPNQRLVAAGGEEDHKLHPKTLKHPTVFIKSRHDDGPTPSKPLPVFVQFAAMKLTKGSDNHGGSSYRLVECYNICFMSLLINSEFSEMK